MKKKIGRIWLSLIFCSMSVFTSAYAADTYEATWASVNQHNPAPEWFQDAKFGIFFHWGAYSVPAYQDEWYPRLMYLTDSTKVYPYHVATYGDPFTDWPYHNFINGAYDKNNNWVEFAPKLKSSGGNFDPDEWAQLFADSGCKFAGPAALHHDGYSLWDSTVNPWNSVDKGPGLDLVGLFAASIRAEGLKFMVSDHSAYNFNGYYEGVPEQSTYELKMLYGQLPAAEEDQLWYDRLKELVDQYQPDYIWNDGNVSKIGEQQRLNFLSYYYNKSVDWGKDVVVSYNDGFSTGEVVQYERQGPDKIVEPFWLTEDSISSQGWSYVVGQPYYSTKAILGELIDRVSKNGCFLLNICPMADGTIPQVQKDILTGIGGWLNIYGEAIYSTRACNRFGEGPTVMGGGGTWTAPVEGTAADIRFTRNKANDTLYMIGLGWPENDQMLVTALKAGDFDTSTITDVSIVGGSSVSWSQDSTGLKVNLPVDKQNDLGYAVKVTFSSAMPLIPYPEIDAFSQIEAEEYTLLSGSAKAQPCAEGGENLGYIATGDYACFHHVDFGGGAVAFQARVASYNGGGKIHVRLDSPDASDQAVLTAPATGDWQVYTTAECSVNITGSHDLYLVFESGLNLNWVTFVEDPSVPKVILYQHTGYAGWSAEFGVGEYTAQDIISAGGADNDASSIKVPDGYKAILYQDDNFGGAFLEKTADDSNLIDAGWNDQVSSMKVVAIENSVENGIVCNPMNLSYRFHLADVSGECYREAADPSVVYYNNRYWLFASKSGGFWHSTNLVDWAFMPTSALPIDEYAPDIRVINNYMVFTANAGAGVYRTQDPLSDNWEQVIASKGGGDKNSFQDDDGKVYLYSGLSNSQPIIGVQVNPDTYADIGSPVDLAFENRAVLGWEVRGDDHTSTDAPYREGAWVNKHNGKYYLQYASPGTQFNIYNDAIYTANSPLGPYTVQAHNPYSYKPYGFMTAAGHGCSFDDTFGNFWHMTTMRISLRGAFERRLGLFPAGYDQDGVLFCNTRFGDYPMNMPDGLWDPWQDSFAGLMLLSLNKPATVSSVKDDHVAANAVDENVRTFWAGQSKQNEWLQVDLGDQVSVGAVQVNLAEEACDQYGRTGGPHYVQYVIEGSADGSAWTTIVDKSGFDQDCPHDFNRLSQAEVIRYVKITLLHMPGDGYCALAGLRVFGNKSGAPPAMASSLSVVRSTTDRRIMDVSWNAVSGAHGYNVLWGVASNKLYNCMQVYGDTSVQIRALSTAEEYWVAVEAFGETGVADVSPAVSTVVSTETIVSFNTPSSDITLTEGSDLYVKVNAVDSDGISQVRLYKDGVKLARNEGGYPYEWGLETQNDPELQNLPAGTFVLTAEATDSLGNIGQTASSITVTVNPIPAVGDTILAVDFGYTGDSYVETNWVGWSTGDIGAGVAAPTTTINGYNLAVASGSSISCLTTAADNEGFNFRLRNPSIADAGSFTQNELMFDRIASAVANTATDGTGSGFYLSISGLDANTDYMIQVWGVDQTGDPATLKNGYVYGFDATGETGGYTSLPELGNYTISNSPTTIADDDAWSISGTVTTDSGGKMVYKTVSNIDKAVMNGFTLSTVASASSGYDVWASTNGITGGQLDDDDGDGLDNLSEYALSEKPTISRTATTFYYVHQQRANDPGLTFLVETCSDLTAEHWTAVEVTSVTNITGGVYNDVTNSISMAGLQSYLRLNVTSQ